MKVINHHKGNYTFDDTQDGSVMYGTVKVTESEWRKVLEYLKRAKYTSNTYHRDGLKHFWSWVYPKHKKLKRLCIGVSNTELVFKHFKLPNYKRQNYVFERL